jgi:Family of unknown function (DUF5899)
MELFAVAAVLGLALLGKKRHETSPREYQVYEETDGYVNEAVPVVQEHEYYSGRGTSEGLHKVDDPITTDVQNIDFNKTRKMLDMQGTSGMPAYGSGLQVSAPNQPGTIPLIKKKEIPTNFGTSGYSSGSTNFVDISPHNSKHVWGSPTNDFRQVSSEHLTRVQNGVSPTGQRINVGRGLGLSADVPAGGGFHSESFRVLPVNANVERLTHLPGAETRGASIIPSGSLAPAISGYSGISGFTDGPAIAKYPNRAEETPYTGLGSAARTFMRSPDPSFEKTLQPTLKDQGLTPYTGPSKSQVNIFNLNPEPVSKYSFNAPTGHRGLSNDYVPFGSQAVAQTKPSISTQNGYQPLVTPPGPMNASVTGQRGSIGELRPTPTKASSNLPQNFDIAKSALATNPYAAPSFAR